MARVQNCKKKSQSVMKRKTSAMEDQKKYSPLKKRLILEAPINLSVLSTDSSSVISFPVPDEGKVYTMENTPAIDVYKFLRSTEAESKRRPLPNYMETIQNDASVKMRAILIDWLVEVAEEYKLVPDTLYLSVSYIDRYLSSFSVNRHKLQLLGVTCLLIASKYEEICSPSVEDFCYITDNTYMKEEVMNVEKDVLKFLNHESWNPTIKTFLRRFTNIAHRISGKSNPQLEFLCCYLAELSLLDYDCIRFFPSMIAASVVFVSNFTLFPNRHPWSLTMQMCTGYRPQELKDCIHVIHDLQLNQKGFNLPAIRKKYSHGRFLCVATLSSPLEFPTFYFEDSEEK